MTFQSNGPVANENYSIATGANSTGPFITVLMTRDPTSFDAQYSVKQRWINTLTSNEWILSGYSNSTGQTLANWLLLAGGFVKSTWTPTLFGATVAGTFVPAIVYAGYVAFDGLVQIEFTIFGTVSGASGDLVIGNLPFPMNPASNSNVVGSVFFFNAIPWPVNTTTVALVGQPLISTTVLRIFASGNNINASAVQIANQAINVQGTIVYEI